jgi:hypothetical protein
MTHRLAERCYRAMYQMQRNGTLFRASEAFWAFGALALILLA